MNKMSKKETWLMLLGCALIAFTFLIFCSGNSFIFEYNYRYDFNWFELMGRGILNHKVPYRDLYEQKGPALYFLFAFFVLCGNAKIATFVFEILLGAVFLFFAYKLFRKFFGISGSILLTIILAFCTFTSNTFNSGGDNVDEYVLPLLSFMVYWFHGYFENPEKNDLKWWQSAIIGFGLGFTLLSKYTILLLPAIMLIIWLVYELIKKRGKAAGKNLLFMLLGFGLIVLPIIIYFAANSALDDMINVYLLTNIRYSGAENYQKMSVLEEMITSVPNLLMFLSFIVIGIMLFSETYRRDKKYILWLLPGLISVTVYLLFLRNIFLYYYHMFSVYLPAALIFVGKGIPKLFEKVSKKKLPSLPKFLQAGIIAILAGLMLMLSTGFSSMSREIYCADIINYPQKSVVRLFKEYEKSDKTIYCYRMMENSIYNMLEITPNDYFYSQNYFSPKAFPEMYNYFDEVLLSGKYDFVVTYDMSYLFKQVYDNYELYYEEDGMLLLINKNLLKN